MDQEKYYESYVKLEKMRQAAYGKVKKLNLIGAALITAGVIFLIFGIAFSDKFITAGSALAFILIIPGIIVMVMASKEKNRFLNGFKEKAVNLHLKDYFEDAKFNPSGRVNQSEIDATRLFQSPDRSYGSDYVEGTYKNVHFKVSEVTMQERRETTDSNGHRHVEYVTYFSGRWYIYRFPKHFNGVIKIIEGGRWARPYSQKNLVKVETESMEFNKKFNSYSSDEHYFFYQITPMMMDRLMQFERAHGGKVVFYFADNEIHLGVSDGKDYFSYNIRKEINFENMKQFRDDITIIPAIVNEFRMDTSKFQSED